MTTYVIGNKVNGKLGVTSVNGEKLKANQAHALNGGKVAQAKTIDPENPVPTPPQPDAPSLG